MAESALRADSPDERTLQLSALSGWSVPDAEHVLEAPGRRGSRTLGHTRRNFGSRVEAGEDLEIRPVARFLLDHPGAGTDLFALPGLRVSPSRRARH